MASNGDNGGKKKTPQKRLLLDPISFANATKFLTVEDMATLSHTHSSLKALVHDHLATAAWNCEVCHETLVENGSSICVGQCVDCCKRACLQCMQNHEIGNRCQKCCDDKKEIIYITCGDEERACIPESERVFHCTECSEVVCDHHGLECYKCEAGVCEWHAYVCLKCGIDHCRECVRRCYSCMEVLCRQDYSGDCHNCGAVTCGDPTCDRASACCGGCGEVYCSRCGDHLCAECGSKSCYDCMHSCDRCGCNICELCLKSCDNCKRSVCQDSCKLLPCGCGGEYCIGCFTRCTLCQTFSCSLNCIIRCRGCFQPFCAAEGCCSVKCPKCDERYCHSCPHECKTPSNTKLKASEAGEPKLARVDREASI